MNWFKKSNQNIDIAKQIMNNSMDINVVMEQLQQSINNPCEVLNTICNSGYIENPFFSTVFQQMCGAQIQQNKDTALQQNIEEQNTNETNIE